MDCGLDANPSTTSVSVAAGISRFLSQLLLPVLSLGGRMKCPVRAQGTCCLCGKGREHGTHLARSEREHGAWMEFSSGLCEL